MVHLKKLLFLIVFLSNVFAANTTITSVPYQINGSGTNYNISANLVAPVLDFGFIFNSSAENNTLDCGGLSITTNMSQIIGSASFSVWGNNNTIRNCNLIEYSARTSNAQADIFGLYLNASNFTMSNSIVNATINCPTGVISCPADVVAFRSQTNGALKNVSVYTSRIYAQYFGQARNTFGFLENFTLINNSIIESYGNGGTVSGVSSLAAQGSLIQDTNVTSVDTSLNNFLNAYRMDANQPNSLTILNNTFNKTNAYFLSSPTGNMTVSWWVDVLVNSASGAVNPSVRVNIFDNTTSLVVNTTTASNGYITRTNLSEARYNSTNTTLLTAHNFTASKGSSWNQTSFNVTANEISGNAITLALPTQFNWQSFNTSNQSTFVSPLTTRFFSNWSNSSAFDTVKLNLDSVNYTASQWNSSASSGVFNANVSGLNVSTHNFYWIFNQTDGTYEQSSTFSFVLLLSTSLNITVHLNGSYANETLTYPQTPNATAWSNVSGVVLVLSRNSTPIAVGTNPTSVNSSLAVATYNFTACAASTENYSGCREFDVFFNKNASQALLLLNGTASDLNISLGQTSNASGVCVWGGAGNMTLDFAIVSSPDIQTFPTSTHTYRLFCGVNENASYDAVGFTLVVGNPTPPPSGGGGGGGQCRAETQFCSVDADCCGGLVCAPTGGNVGLQRTCIQASALNNSAFELQPTELTPPAFTGADPSQTILFNDIVLFNTGNATLTIDKYYFDCKGKDFCIDENWKCVVVHGLQSKEIPVQGADRIQLSCTVPADAIKGQSYETTFVIKSTSGVQRGVRIVILVGKTQEQVATETIISLKNRLFAPLKADVVCFGEKSGCVSVTKTPINVGGSMVTGVPAGAVLALILFVIALFAGGVGGIIILISLFALALTFL